MIKKFQQFITENLSLQNDFGITYNDLGEIMYYITDEFQDLDWSPEDSSHSSLIEQDNNCFIIELWDKTTNTLPWEDRADMKVLYHVEPKISNLIEDVSSQLGQYELEVYTADFGSTDAYYEIVITKIGHTPKDKKRDW
jgi:hypothetical protein